MRNHIRAAWRTWLSAEILNARLLFLSLLQRRLSLIRDRIFYEDHRFVGSTIFPIVRDKMKKHDRWLAFIGQFYDYGDIREQSENICGWRDFRMDILMKQSRYEMM